MNPKPCSPDEVRFRGPDEGERQCWEQLRAAALAAVSRRQPGAAGKRRYWAPLIYMHGTLPLLSATSLSFVWLFPAWVFINVKLMSAEKQQPGKNSRFQCDIITN